MNFKICLNRADNHYYIYRKIWRWWLPCWTWADFANRKVFERVRALSDFTLVKYARAYAESNGYVYSGTKVNENMEIVVSFIANEGYE